MTLCFCYNLMMRSILRQASWLVLAQASTRIIGFFYTIFLARNLGVLDFGIFSVGLAYFSIISSLADFGFNRFLIKEVAQEKGRTWELFWNLVMFRLTLICCFFAIFSLVLYIFDQDKLRVSIILLSFLAVLPQVIAVTFDGIFIALKKLQFSAIPAFISSLSTVLVGLILVSKGLAVFGAVTALILGQIILALSLIFLLYKTTGIKLAEVKLAVIKKAVLGSMPYGILSVLGLLYFRIDTIMLSYMKGNFETGIYSAGYKFLESLVFIPNALSFALFPRFVNLHINNPSKLKDVLFKSIKIIFLLGALIMFAYLLILPSIINFFLPSFKDSVTVIKILSITIPLMFVHVSASAVLLSTDKYLKQVIYLSIFPLILNILLNFLLIPKFGFLGASFVTVVSDLFSTIIIFYAIKKFILLKP